MGNDPSRAGPRRMHGHLTHGSQQLLQAPQGVVAPPKTPAERLANVEQLVFEEIEMPDVGSVLGYGASAKVVKGIWKKTPVAVKRFFDLVNPDEFVNEVLTQRFFHFFPFYSIRQASCLMCLLIARFLFQLFETSEHRSVHRIHSSTHVHRDTVLQQRISIRRLTCEGLFNKRRHRFFYIFLFVHF